MLKVYKPIIAKLLVLAMAFQCIPIEFAFAANRNDNFMNIPVPTDSELNMGIMTLADEELNNDNLYADFDNEELKIKEAEQKLIKEDELLQNLFLTETIDLNSRNTVFSDKDGKEVFKEGNSVYASGLPILIKKENDEVYIYDKSGENKLIDEPINSNVTIYGGGKNVSVDSSEIIMQEGTVAGIVGGGRTGSVLNDAKITISGGNVTGLICGGGKEIAANVKNTYITVSGNVSAKWIYGGGYDGNVLENTNIDINGGNFAYICGGSYQGDVNGNSNLDIKNCTISDTVFAGGWKGKINGSTNLKFESSTAQYLCGGGYLTDGNQNSDSTVGQNTEISILNGNISEKVYGGGWTGNVAGSSKVTLSGGTVANLYGGGYEGSVKESANIIMTGGNVTATVFGGGQKETAEVKDIYCTLSGGTVGFLYGGGWKAKTNGNVNILLTGTIINNIAFGGGYFNTATVNNTKISVSNGSTSEIIYGGGENASVLENTSISVDGGKIKNIYAGGRNEGADVSGHSDIVINDGEVNFLYGGGNSSNLLSSDIKILGGVLQSIYGGAGNGTVQNTNITVDNGEIGWIYGGGKDGLVTESNVTINGGTVLYNVFGGGRNSGADVNLTNVIINGGTVNNVFGGGDKANVLEKNTLSVITEKSIPFVSGGGYSGSSNEIIVKVSDGEIKTLYGGGYSGNAENVNIEILNGDVSQLILGSGTNGITKKSEANVYGGVIRDLYSGYYDDIKLYYLGGSILINRPGIAFDNQNNSLYKTELFIGDKTLPNKAVKCKFDNSNEWYSKTDNYGKLVVYLPLNQVNITVEDEESGKIYTGSVTADINGTTSVTLLEKSDQQEEYIVSFGVKSGNGTITAMYDNSEFISGNTVKKGENITFKATPNKNFYIENWFCNGEALNINADTYTIDNISQPMDIKVSFAKNAVDFEQLNELIEMADLIKNEVVVSIDGNDLETDQKWVSRNIMKEFQNAINSAKAIVNNSEVSQDDVDSAKNDLEEAKQLFESSIQYGNGIIVDVDRSVLNNLITSAEDAKLEILVSADGSDIEKTQKWVTQDVMDIFISAIEEAENIADNQSAVQEEIDEAVEQLKNEIEIFTASQKYGEKELKFQIEYNSGDNGSIEAYVNGDLIESPYMVLPEDIILFKAIPEKGYVIDYWTKNGAMIENNNETFELEQVQEETVISVYFKKEDIEEPEKYSLNLSDDIKNGLISVSESGLVEAGTVIYLNVFPDNGYYLLENSLKYNGIIIENNSFRMPNENVIITAEFLPVDKSYTLTVSSDIGGTATGGGNFEEGAEIKIIAYAVSGYRFDKWESQHENYIKDINNSETTIIMPGNDVTVKALFKPVKSSGGSSGDSSSSDDSYTNTTTTSKPSVETKPLSYNVKTEENDSSITAEIYANVNPDNSGNYYLNVKDSDLSKALDSANKKTDSDKEKILRVSLNINAGTENTNLKSVHFVMPENISSLYNESNFEQLYLDTPNISMRIDQRALKSILSQSQGSIQFSISKMKELSDEASKMVGDRPVFEIIILSNHKQITAFGGGQITIFIPYELKEQEKSENIKACYIDNNGNASIWKDSYYNDDDKFLAIKTTHFSGFGVADFYEDSEQQEQPEEEKISFNDISGHWAENDIIEMAENGIINGMNETDFMPNSFITRGMFVTILGRVSNVSESEYSLCGFNDVALDSYYMPYIAWASENNIVSGTGSNNFSPDVPLTRDEMSVILYNYILYNNKELPEIKDAVVFDDDVQISQWARNAVYALQKAGLLYGKKNNLFEPDEKATRAEATVLINRVLKFINN